MTDTGFPSSPLPEELGAALRRATDRTIVAIQSLRKAVRNHVHFERSQGASLDEIDHNLRSMIRTAGGDSDHPDFSSDRIDELTKQVLSWTDSFYKAKKHDGS
jgi:hypothetical protein